MVTWKCKYCNQECPLLTFFLLYPFFFSWQHHMVWDTHLVAWGLVSLLCPLPTCAPQPRAAWEEALQHSSIARILVFFFNIFFLVTNLKHSNIWATVKKMNYIPAKSVQMINPGITCHSWLGKMPHSVPEVNCNVEYSYITPVVLQLLLPFFFFYVSF